MKAFYVFLLAAAMLLNGCSPREAPNEQSFVGKWKSSRLESSPLYLNNNGEWEIKLDDGKVLQYGVWEYKDKKIIWSHKIDGDIRHEANPVLSLSSKGFRVQEVDGSTTFFERLD